MAKTKNFGHVIGIYIVSGIVLIAFVVVAIMASR
jgi:hypothetical protein